jgi:hypothetical protein
MEVSLNTEHPPAVQGYCFSRLFKKIYSCSPAHYRKSIKNQYEPH